jgi:hypothetical protein
LLNATQNDRIHNPFPTFSCSVLLFRKKAKDDDFTAALVQLSSGYNRITKLNLRAAAETPKWV